MGRPPQDLSEPDWARVARELKREGVTLTLLWQEYRAALPDGYGFTWFCDRFAAFRQRTSAVFRNRHAAGAVMQTDYAGQTVPVIDPATGVIHAAQIFVAVLGASNLTFAFASFSLRLPDWIDGQVRALSFFGGITKAIVWDNLKAGVAKALWFEPTLNATFAAMAEHYDTTILPTRSRKPRDKGKVEGAVLIVERWILARLRNRSFFSIAELNTAIAELLEELNNRPMRHVGKSRRELFEEIERAALRPLPAAPFEYAEWKTAKVHPDYRQDLLLGAASADRPHRPGAAHPPGGRDLPRSPARRQPCPALAALRPCHRQHPHAQGPSALCQYDTGQPDRPGGPDRPQRRHPGRAHDARPATSGTGIPRGHGHPVAVAALRAGAHRGGLRPGAADQRDHLRLRHRHPQIRPRPGQLRRAGKADTAARQHPRLHLLPVKERKKEC
ncbi:Transposase [Mesorhizobium muleiense]|uniref:Transposase n=1 Tax=Mesorhizobium muleiense TaxID=1004279 RepID=A0A1G8I3F9_9HYPH|nr:Transposase [Mesorhizobium muleiense]